MHIDRKEKRDHYLCTSSEVDMKGKDYVSLQLPEAFHEQLYSKQHHLKPPEERGKGVTLKKIVQEIGKT